MSEEFESPSGTREGTRRAIRMNRTRDALRLAGLELFASKGFEHVTVEEIASGAGVSRRTFFRYFESKEDVLYLGEHRFFSQFSAIFLRLPSSVPDLDAISTTFAALSAHTSRGRDALLLARRAVATSAALRGREQDHVRADMAVIGQAIADRHGLDQPDDGCRLLAAMSVTAYRLALDKWLREPPPEDLAQIIVDQFDLLRGLAEQRVVPSAPAGSGGHAV